MTDFKSWDELYPERFLRSDQFRGRQPTFTITGITAEELPGEQGNKTLAIVAFKETPKVWAVNKTNKRAIVAMFGADPGACIGKRITLVAEPFRDGTAIRVLGSPDLDNEITIRSSVNGKIKARKLVNTGKSPAPGGAP